MQRNLRITMTDEAGQTCHWTVRHSPGRPVGWEYIDHEGYRRFVEGNWLDLVQAFRRTAENYGFTSTLS